jgi:hypothetical protein
VFAILVTYILMVGRPIYFGLIDGMPIVSSLSTVYGLSGIQIH